MQAIGRVTLRPRTVNWKNIADNYSDNLHIRVAHPGLTRLFGKTYGSQAGEWADRLWGTLLDRPSENRSERMYQRILLAWRTCRRRTSGCGSISSSGRTSPSTSIPTRSTSCSSFPSRRPRR